VSGLYRTSKLKAFDFLHFKLDFLFQSYNIFLNVVNRFFRLASRTAVPAARRLDYTLSGLVVPFIVPVKASVLSTFFLKSFMAFSLISLIRLVIPGLSLSMLRRTNCRAARIGLILTLTLILDTSIPAALALCRIVQADALMPWLALNTLNLRIPLSAALILPLTRTLAVIAATPLIFRPLLLGSLLVVSLLRPLGFVCVLYAFSLILVFYHSNTSSKLKAVFS
jgi:hypothetical protein